MRLFYVSNIYCPAGTKALEKELAKFAGTRINYTMDIPAIKTFTEELKSLQAGIIKEHPRLRPVEIQFKLDNSRYAHGIQFIRFGQCSISLMEFGGIIVEGNSSGRTSNFLVPGEEVTIVKEFVTDSRQKYHTIDEMKDVLKNIETALIAVLEMSK